MAAAEVDGKGGERGEPAAAKPRGDPFNPAESNRLSRWMVADILVVSEEEGEGTKRMAVAGGQRQPTAPNGRAAAVKFILPAVRRKEEGKGRRGRTGAGGAEGGDRSTGGQGQTGKKGKGQVEASGAKKPAGDQEGKGGKRGGQGHQWPRPHHSFGQLPQGSSPQVSAEVRAEEAREARRQQTAP